MRPTQRHHNHGCDASYATSCKEYHDGSRGPNASSREYAGPEVINR